MKLHSFSYTTYRLHHNICFIIGSLNLIHHATWMHHRNLVRSNIFSGKQATEDLLLFHWVIFVYLIHIVIWTYHGIFYIYFQETKPLRHCCLSFVWWYSVPMRRPTLVDTCFYATYCLVRTNMNKQWDGEHDFILLKTMPHLTSAAGWALGEAN